MTEQENNPVRQDSAEVPAFKPLSRDVLLDALRDVHDPDLHMDIVELGLVYDVEHQPDGRVRVVMTLTSPHCPYGPEIVREVQSVLMFYEGVKGVQVDVVWDPPWSIERMSEEARLELGLE